MLNPKLTPVNNGLAGSVKPVALLLLMLLALDAGLGLGLELFWRLYVLDGAGGGGVFLATVACACD